MARKKKHPEHVNHERWLVSFADFMTLLMAFFVVMFAVSQVDSKKVGRFSEQFSKAVGIDMFPEPGKGLLAGAPENVIENDNEAAKKGPGQGALPDELAQIREALMGSKAADESLAKVQVIARRNELVLRLSDNLFFETGSDTLTKASKDVVSRLAKELKTRKVDIRVEGHTDNRPIHTARFRNNWDLSTARATTIVATFAGEGFQPDRLSSAGYAEFHPIAPNDSEDGRKQNRRVDIVVTVPVPQAKVEPIAEEPGSPTPALSVAPVLGHDEVPAKQEEKHEEHPAPAHGDEHHEGRH